MNQIEQLEALARYANAFAELATIAQEWDAESGRAVLFSEDPLHSAEQKKRAMQRAMLLHHHAAAIEGCLERAKP